MDSSPLHHTSSEALRSVDDTDYFADLPDLDEDDLDELGLASPVHSSSLASSPSTAFPLDTDTDDNDNDNDNENSSNDGGSDSSLFSFLSPALSPRPRNRSGSLSSDLYLDSPEPGSDPDFEAEHQREAHHPPRQLFSLSLGRHSGLLAGDGDGDDDEDDDEDDDNEYTPPPDDDDDDGLDDLNLDLDAFNEEDINEEDDEYREDVDEARLIATFRERAAQYYIDRIGLASSARNMDAFRENPWRQMRGLGGDPGPSRRFFQLPRELPQSQAQDPSLSRRRQAQEAGAQGPQTVIDLTRESSSPEEPEQPPLLSRAAQTNRRQPRNRQPSVGGLALPSSRHNRSIDDSIPAHNTERPGHSHRNNRQNTAGHNDDRDAILNELFVPQARGSAGARRGGPISTSNRRPASLVRSGSGSGSSSIPGSGVTRNPPRRAAGRAPRASNTAPPVIDLTEDADDDPVHARAPRRARNGVSQPAGAVSQPAGAVVIDLSHEDHDDDAPQVVGGAPREGAGGAGASGWAARLSNFSNLGNFLSIGRALVLGGNNGGGPAGDNNYNARGVPWMERTMFGLPNTIPNPLGMAGLDLDYGANGYDDILVGFDIGTRLARAKPVYTKPPAAEDGFTRGTDEARSKEDEVELVCAGCEQELKYDPDATTDNERPVKKRRKDNAEYHFWAVKECGHVFCKSCFDNRKPLAKSAKKAVKDMPETRFRLEGKKLACAVEDCGSDTTAKGAWVGIFL